METENTTTQTTAPARIKGEDKKVKLSTVIELLDKGKTRREIRDELGLTNNQAKKLFGHEKIKGKKRHYTKAITKAEIEVEDDLPEVEDDLEVEGEPVQAEQGEQASATDIVFENAAPAPQAEPVAAGTQDEW